MPAEADGAVDVDEDEEWSSGEDVDTFLVVDGGCDKVLLPVFGGEVEQFFHGSECLRSGCDVG